MTAGLKPCPFCGGSMEDRGYGAIHIDGGGCPIGDHAIAVEKWNRRTSEAATEGWDDTRSILLAAASAASGAVTDLVEAARLATGQNFTRANQIETITMLIDALRLAVEAKGGEGDEMLLVSLDNWVADNA